MNQGKNNLTVALEALLFVCGEPLAFKKAAKSLGVDNSELKEVIEDLARRLKNGGLTLINNGEYLQLAAKAELASLLVEFQQEDFKKELSPPALETLSIIAYSGPVSKAEIEYIRGVNATFVLRNLMLRGLIDRKDKGVYQVSVDFLRHLGISKVDELPNFIEYQLLRKKVTENNEREKGDF